MKYLTEFRDGAVAQRIAREIAAAQIGKTVRVLVETPTTGRTEADAPEVDGQVLLGGAAKVGGFAEVRITGTSVYDLVGEMV